MPRGRRAGLVCLTHTRVMAPVLNVMTLGKYKCIHLNDPDERKYSSAYGVYSTCSITTLPCESDSDCCYDTDSCDLEHKVCKKKEYAYKRCDETSFDSMCGLPAETCRLENGTTIECCNGIKCNDRGIYQCLDVGETSTCDEQCCSTWTSDREPGPPAFRRRGPLFCSEITKKCESVYPWPW